MFAAASKALFHVLPVRPLKRLASRYGMAPDSVRPPVHRRRDRGGGDRGGARAAASGFDLTLDYLGESVRTLEQPTPPPASTCGSSNRSSASGIERNISFKLTQLGLGVDRATAIDNLRRILDARRPRVLRAHRHGEFGVHRLTLDVLETLWALGYRNVGTVIQSCLMRSAGRRRAAERARRARAAGEGRLPRAGERRATSARPTWTPRTSRWCSACSTTIRIRPSPRTIRR